MTSRKKLYGWLSVVLLCNFCTLHTKKNSKPKKISKYQKQVDEYKKITVKDILLENKNIKKEDFLFGVGTSSYQVEGSAGAKNKTYNQWLELTGKEIELEVDNKKEKKTLSDPLNGCEHWDRYKEDIQLVKNLGCNTYRFSISWGKINPQEGKISQKALSHYEDVCKELKKNNIRPIITLYHYTHPIWFEKKGAFEKEENISHFVDYAIKVFERLNKYNPMWATINTFTGASLQSYYMGTKPPFKKDMGLALEVLKNILEAHVRFYRTAKNLKNPVTKKPIISTIGIYKSMFVVEKYRSWQFWDNIGISFVEKLNNESIYDFFTTGKLNISLGIPALFIKNSISHENKDAIGAADWVGCNYYSGGLMSNFGIKSHKENIPTQSSLLSIYPEGFYTALHSINDGLAKPLSIPIYVTENGIPTNNEEHRDVFYRSHLQIVSKVIQEGMDIRGYVVWTLMDNFDWLEGYNFNFGLYAVDRKTQKRTLKDGATFYVDVIKHHNAPTKKIIEKDKKNIPLNTKTA